MDNQHEPTLFGLKFDENTKAEIKSIATWAAFISYTVFGFLFLFFLGLIFGGKAVVEAFKQSGQVDAGTAGMAGTMVILVAGFIMAIFGVWFYFLFRASQQFKKAVTTGNVYSFNEGVKSLNTYFIIAVVFTALSVFTGFIGLF
ncbi:hypothetical protein ACFS6H_12300 [Terrimonas rubra]|uniref:DUF1206 domain-containing protein n=1 Tax=Terrimonas rubra TaxID=1035890 RepID=A0ABW6A9X0_9BACT